jgi:hypothetical protein
MRHRRDGADSNAIHSYMQTLLICMLQDRDSGAAVEVGARARIHGRGIRGRGRGAVGGIPGWRRRGRHRPCIAVQAPGTAEARTPVAIGYRLDPDQSVARRRVNEPTVADIDTDVRIAVAPRIKEDEISSLQGLAQHGLPDTRDRL